MGKNLNDTICSGQPNGTSCGYHLICCGETCNSNYNGTCCNGQPCLANVGCDGVTGNCCETNQGGYAGGCCSTNTVACTDGKSCCVNLDDCCNGTCCASQEGGCTGEQCTTCINNQCMFLCADQVTHCPSGETCCGGDCCNGTNQTCVNGTCQTNNCNNGTSYCYSDQVCCGGNSCSSPDECCNNTRCETGYTCYTDPSNAVACVPAACTEEGLSMGCIEPNYNVYAAGGYPSIECNAKKTCGESGVCQDPLISCNGTCCDTTKNVCVETPGPGPLGCYPKGCYNENSGLCENFTKECCSNGKCVETYDGC